MTKLLIGSILSFTFIQAANANIFEDSVSADEIANVLFNCSDDMNAIKDSVMSNGPEGSIVYVKDVKGKSRTTRNGNVTTKSYEIHVYSSDGGFSEENLEGILKIKQKVTQTEGAAPSKVEFSCGSN